MPIRQRLLLLTVLLACVAPSVSAAQARSPRARCAIRGDGEVPRVRVSAGAAGDFELELTGLPLTVTPTRGERARVRTTSGLIFEGSTLESEVPVALAREVSVGRGVLTLRPGTDVKPVRLFERRVSVELMQAVRVSSVAVPCDALRVAATSAGTPPPADAPTSGALRTRGTSFRVHARSGGPFIVIEAHELRVVELERRAGWVRVRRDFAAGSTLIGWVREASVEQVEPAAFAEIGHGSGSGLGLCGTGSRAGYIGPATLTDGSDVRDAPAGTVWAHADGDVELRQVYVTMSDGWARIERIAGIEDYEGCTTQLDRAWVPVSALRFPAGAQGVPASQVEPADH